MVFWKGENKVDAVFKELTEIFPEINNYTTSNLKSPHAQSKIHKKQIYAWKNCNMNGKY